MVPRVAIIEAKRTPIGKFMGGFQNKSAADLGVDIVRATAERAGIDLKHADELIFGHARQAGNGPNIARQISYRAGIPQDEPSFTVNMACASGIKAIALGSDSIQMGHSTLVVTGGTENMTHVPYLLDRARTGYRLGNSELVDAMYRDGFKCPIADMVMGETAELLADEYKISREEQDEWAALSQNRAEVARKKGLFNEEIIPVEAPDNRGNPVLIEADEHPRDGVTPEALAKLPPVFRKDGTVTAGNASGITDAAASIILASEDRVNELAVKPRAWIHGFAIVGRDPKRMGVAVVPAIRKLLERNSLAIEDIDLIEMNEAFAAQFLACQRDLKFVPEQVNVNGGSISLGHPIGATGARIVVTLLHEMERRDVQLGLAALCVSGGQGAALLIKRT